MTICFNAGCFRGKTVVLSLLLRPVTGYAGIVSEDVPVHDIY